MTKVLYTIWNWNIFEVLDIIISWIFKLSIKFCFTLQYAVVRRRFLLHNINYLVLSGRRSTVGSRDSWS